MSRLDAGPWGPAPALSHLGPRLSCGQKADKSALAAKVSRVQFDATTEQLNHMMQELVAKMSDHEQDWQKMLDKLLVEMDSKVRADSGSCLEAADHALPRPAFPSAHCLPTATRSWTAWSWTP